MIVRLGQNLAKNSRPGDAVEVMNNNEFEKTGRKSMAHISDPNAARLFAMLIVAPQNLDSM
jgi:hypothetical protein